MTYNPQKHNRKSTRLQNYDYSQAGYYFITICTQHNQKLFGEIKNGKMVLNSYGKVAENWLNEIPKKYNHTEIDCYVIMPNHIHFILKIDDIKYYQMPGRGEVPSPKSHEDSITASDSSGKDAPHSPKSQPGYNTRKHNTRKPPSTEKGEGTSPFYQLWEK